MPMSPPGRALRHMARASETSPPGPVIGVTWSRRAAKSTYTCPSGKRSLAHIDTDGAALQCAEPRVHGREFGRPIAERHSGDGADGTWKWMSPWMGEL